MSSFRVRKITAEPVAAQLERFGVDVVLSGHSHVYERSFLIQGHTGNSASFNIKSYQNDKVVEVIVASGNVEFSGIGSMNFKSLNFQ